MISDRLKSQLESMRSSKKIPSVLLVTGLYNPEHKKEKLAEAANYLELDDGGLSTVTEAKGNLLVLDSENSSSIKVDDVREMLSKISLKNWDLKQGRYVLIPQAELLTVQSSNALLKSLEEAPVGTHFILGAPSKRSVLRTILSRSFAVQEVDQAAGPTESSDKNNAFLEAFFNKDFSAFAKLTKADLRYEWQAFQIKSKDQFVEQAYSGALDRNRWHKVFDFMEELDQKIEANMDVKMIASAVERYVLRQGGL